MIETVPAPRFTYDPVHGAPAAARAAWEAAGCLILEDFVAPEACDALIAAADRLSDQLVEEAEGHRGVYCEHHALELRQCGLPQPALVQRRLLHPLLPESGGGDLGASLLADEAGAPAAEGVAARPNAEATSSFAPRLSILHPCAVCCMLYALC